MLPLNLPTSKDYLVLVDHNNNCTRSLIKVLMVSFDKLPAVNRILSSSSSTSFADAICCNSCRIALGESNRLSGSRFALCNNCGCEIVAIRVDSLDSSQIGCVKSNRLTES